MRLAVAALLVASLLGVVVVDARRDDARPVAGALAATTTTSAVTTTSPTTTTATAAVPVVPPPMSPPATGPTVSAPPVTSPPAPGSATPSPAPARGAIPKVVVSPRGVVLAVRGLDGDRLRVGTPCGRSALLSGGAPVHEAAVVLDAGHGGVEPGAVSPGGLAEKGVNLAVVGHAKDALERAGVRAVRTRTSDYRMTLGARAEVVMALKPRAFVSVHHNAEPDGPRDGPGSETYYQVASPDSKRLAGLVYEEVVRALSVYRLAWVADTDAGAKYRRSSSGDDYYGILRRTQGVASVLAELAFVSNPPEADLIGRPDVQQVEGEAVARGILRFLNTSDPGSGFVEPYPRDSPAGSGGGAAGCVDPPL